jgi:hypothetical protein
MTDPLTIAGAGLTVLGSKDLLNKLLGPTADYLGGELKNFVEQCNVNLDNVFQAAFRKLGARAGEPGSVNPRILKHVIDEGRFCEDELMVEYLGGVLASSKSEVSRDDRGTFFLNMISSLSSYQLRTHYMIYAAIVRAGKPRDQNLEYWFEDNTITVCIPEEGYISSMEYSETESHDEISYHSFLGLEMKGLVEGGMRVFHESHHSEISVPNRLFWPTRYGYELFLWGLGLGNRRASSYFELDQKTPLPVEPPFKVLRISLGKMLSM